MSSLRIAAVCCCLSVAVSAAPGPRWIPGLDIVIPVYDAIDRPAIDRLGYDRELHIATRLYVQSQCYTTWTWVPTPNEGAITALIQIDTATIALYHESGYLRLEVMPASFRCHSVLP